MNDFFNDSDINRTKYNPCCLIGEGHGNYRIIRGKVLIRVYKIVHFFKLLFDQQKYFFRWKTKKYANFYSLSNFIFLSLEKNTNSGRIKFPMVAFLLKWLMVKKCHFFSFLLSTICIPYVNTFFTFFRFFTILKILFFLWRTRKKEKQKGNNNNMFLFW